MALTNKLTAIGNAIRAKNGETALYTLDEMPQKIAAIEGGSGGSGSSILPSEYKEVEFLQVDGSQYIITDYYPTRNTNIISRYYSPSGNIYVYGVRNSGDTASFSFMKAGGSSTLANCRIGSAIVQHSTFVSYADSNLKSVPNDVGANSVYLKIVDVFSSTFEVSKYGDVIPEEFTSALPLYIFNCNQEGAATSSGFNGNLYKLTIKENDVIVRDYIPCYRKSDSKPGLYDIVNKQFYTNAGGGEFSFPEYEI